MIRNSKPAIFVGVVIIILLGFHLWSNPVIRFPQPKPEDFSDIIIVDKPVDFPQAVDEATLYAEEVPKAPPRPVDHIHYNASADAPCQSLPGGDDVVIVMRTGATEIGDKLPIHFKTSFKCYPHLIIFSDYEEVFEGVQVYDALADIDESIKSSHEDFQHYNHVHEVGISGLDPSELSGQVSNEGSPTGKGDNAGWRLDKWKFLPMMPKTLQHYPDKKWYIFVEPDSYLVWSNLLQWLPRLDASKPLYFGSPVQIGDDTFAHGGSVFAVSRPALEKGAEQYAKRTQYWHDFTAGHWAGDCIFGKALYEAGVDLSWGHPMFQGGNPASMDWGDQEFWCSPALSYHHLNPEEKVSMWHLEQDWIRTRHAETNYSATLSQDKVLRHGDVCQLFIVPRLVSERRDWNNDYEREVDYAHDTSLDSCRALCDRSEGCLQYTLTPTGCLINEQPKLGRSESGIQSGWMMHRIDSWIHSKAKCAHDEGWRVD